MTNKNLTTDPAVALFSSIYDSDGITAASLASAQSSFSINYIASSYFQNTFSPPTAIAASSSAYRPEVSFDEPTHSSSSLVLTLSNVKLTQTGTVYMILTFNKRIIYNDITGHVDIEIREAVTPSSSNIFNCQDAYGDAPLECKRIALIKGQSRTVTFSNVSLDSMYIVYYTVAN